MIFRLNKEFLFPDPALAEEDGLLAVGGDLQPGRLKLAYQKGIFPWYSEGEPILWYSPHERFVLFPAEVNISRSVKKFLKREDVEIKMNSCFEEVISACKNISRKDQTGTWITPEMRRAYIQLHHLGLAHSVEVFVNGQLSGGLYGVDCGQVFCGESMFSKVSDASKSALVWLCQRSQYQIIDCQVYTSHLESMGARFISRNTYLDYLQKK